MTTQTKLYELMFLVPGNASAEEANKTLDEVKKEIKSLGGDIHSEENWGRRELAYTVAKNDYGYYFVVRTNLDAQKAKDLNDFCRLQRDVVRFLLLILPEDYTPVDYSEVKTKFGGRVKEETPEAESKADAKAKKSEKKTEEKKEKVEEKIEETKDDEKKSEKKSDKNLDDILSDLDSNL